MKLLTGTYSKEWGHTWLTKKNGRIYAAASTAEDAALAVFSMDGSPGTDSSPAILIEESGSTAPAGELVCRQGTSGSHPCHITLLGHQAITSDYTSGTLSVFELDREGLPCSVASLLRFPVRDAQCSKSVNRRRQESPHIHSSWLSGDGRKLAVADLGSDRLFVLPVSGGRIDINRICCDADGCVDAAKHSIPLPEGCGPRHCTFGKSIIYVSTELSDEVLVLSWPGGRLIQRAVTNEMLPGGGGHLALSPDGKFLYVSSRLKGDGIAVFAVNENGLLDRKAFQKTGLHPRHFSLSEDGDLLAVACRDSGTVEIYHRNRTDGLLSLRHAIKAEKPVFVEFVN